MSRSKTTYWTTELIDSSQNQTDPKNACYTPWEIAEKMARRIDYKKGMTVLDPCVGRGSLLAAMMDVWPDLNEEEIYGCDIDPVSITQCRSYFPKGHFIVADILKDDLKDPRLWMTREKTEVS